MHKFQGRFLDFIDAVYFFMQTINYFCCYRSWKSQTMSALKTRHRHSGGASSTSLTHNLYVVRLGLIIAYNYKRTTRAELLEARTIASDGVAVVVHPANLMEPLSSRPT